MNTVLLALVLLAIACVIGLLRACWIRAHDGHVNTFAEIRDDVYEDTRN